MKNKQLKTNLNPALRKKNGVWVKVLVPAFCIIAGAGAMAGLVAGVPQVGDLLIKQNTSATLPTPGTNNNSELTEQIKTLNIKLTEANDVAEERLTTINTINVKLTTLESEKATLTNRIIEVENNAELDAVEKAEQIAELNSQIETLESDKTSLSAQLAQAVTDKQTAENTINQLTAQIETLQAKIDKFEGNAIVDTLQLENFEGVWYKDGTFADYLTIEETTITRGANEDIGVLYKLKNQVYLGLNSFNNTACALSENGTKITLADGTVYTNSFINTLEDSPINMGLISGIYNNGTTTIKLNSDNTVEYSENDLTYYGAFVATATKKNVGGNITLKHNIKLTINKNDTQEMIEFTIINNGNLINEEGVYNKILGAEQTIANVSDVYKTNCYKVAVKLDEPIVLTSGFRFGIWLGHSNGLYVNGSAAGSSGYYSHSLVNSTGSDLKLSYLTLYIKPQYSSFNIDNLLNLVLFDASKSFYSSNAIYYDYDVVSAEIIGTPVAKLNFVDYIEKHFKYEDIDYKTCSTIESYYTGNYTTENLKLNLTADGTTLTTSADETLEVTSTTVTAKTDGTNIIHTITIVYNDLDGVSHTISYEITNNAITPQNGALDGTEIAITKD